MPASKDGCNHTVLPLATVRGTNKLFHEAISSLSISLLDPIQSVKLSLGTNIQTPFSLYTNRSISNLFHNTTHFYIVIPLLRLPLSHPFDSNIDYVALVDVCPVFLTGKPAYGPHFNNPPPFQTFTTTVPSTASNMDSKRFASNKLSSQPVAIYSSSSYFGISLH